MITNCGEITDRKHYPRFENRINGLAEKEHRPRGITNRGQIAFTGIVHQAKNQNHLLIIHVLTRRYLPLTRLCDRDESRPRSSRLGQCCPIYMRA
ncbi:MAG: hypothetical protein ACFFC7_27340 [Candidatus Hermodarchaeota archaeon]